MVDSNGYFVFVKAGFLGHNADATCYRQANVPALPRGTYMLGDAGFPRMEQLITPARRGQLPANLLQGVNK